MNVTTKFGKKFHFVNSDSMDCRWVKRVKADSKFLTFFHYFFHHPGKFGNISNELASKSMWFPTNAGLCLFKNHPLDSMNSIHWFSYSVLDWSISVVWCNVEGKFYLKISFNYRTSDYLTKAPTFAQENVTKFLTENGSEYPRFNDARLERFIKILIDGGYIPAPPRTSSDQRGLASNFFSS